MKTKKNLFCILFILFFCITTATYTFAAQDMPRLTDNANLLTADEKEEILTKLDEISERQQTDIVIVTTNTLDGKTPANYADDFYDYNGYGYGDEKDGVLLLISMEDNDWQISTCGYGMTAITDDGIEYISDKFLTYLKDKNYANAFLTFAQLCDEFITQAKTGQPYDGSHMPKNPFNALTSLIVSAGIGIVLSLIITGLMKAKLKSVKMQSAATNYVKSNSMNLTESRDMFLYNTISRSEKPKSNGAGGSSSHTSSSGRTHGGSGGKF